MIPILVSVLVVVMLIGPLMMLKPTKKQKKQAKLRSLALKQGLVVSGGMTLPNGRYVARYILPYDSEQQSKPVFELQRQKFSHGAHYDGVWDWKDDKEVWPFDDAPFKKLLFKCRSDFYCVGASRMGAYVVWGEAIKDQSEEEAVASVHDFLHALINLVERQSTLREVELETHSDVTD